MTGDESRHWAESFRPSADVKESLPLGSRYPMAKAFSQFYAEIQQQLEQESKDVAKNIKSLEKEVEGVRVENDRIVIPEQCDPEKVAAWIKALKRLIQIRRSLTRIQELANFEDNDSYKVGLAELGELLRSSEPMLAMGISAKKD